MGEEIKADGDSSGMGRGVIASEMMLFEILYHTANAFADPALAVLCSLKKGQPVAANLEFLGRFSAAATSLTLACELYIKGIFHAIGLKQPWGHELHALFMKLPVGSQAHIERTYGPSRVGEDLYSSLTFAIANNMKYGAFAEQPVFEMFDLLKAEEDAFKQWRYLHEIAPELQGSPKEGLLSFNVGPMVRLAASLKAQYVVQGDRVVGLNRYSDDAIQPTTPPSSAAPQKN